MRLRPAGTSHKLAPSASGKPVLPEVRLRMPSITLDEKSARTIARGRIEKHDQAILEKFSQDKSVYPSKRLAWLRSVEADLPARFGKSLLSVMHDKRRVCAIVLGGLGDEKPGWIALTVLIFPFKHRAKPISVAYFSAHSVARLMERLREVDPIQAVRSELLEWSFMPLIKANGATEELICPTKTGYFAGTWDPEYCGVVFKTWLPDRLSSALENEVLNKLRKEARLGRAREMKGID